MAITINQQKKRQKSLLFLMALVVLITAGVLWYGFGTDVRVPSDDVAAPPTPVIDVDFDTLDRVGDFTDFELITPLDDEIGRDNPFVPYDDYEPRVEVEEEEEEIEEEI